MWYTTQSRWQKGRKMQPRSRGPHSCCHLWAQCRGWLENMAVLFSVALPRSGQEMVVQKVRTIPPSSSFCSCCLVHEMSAQPTKEKTIQFKHDLFKNPSLGVNCPLVPKWPHCCVSQVCWSRTFHSTQDTLLWRKRGRWRQSCLHPGLCQHFFFFCKTLVYHLF